MAEPGSPGLHCQIKCYDPSTPRQLYARVKVSDGQGKVVGETSCKVDGQTNVVGRSEATGAESCVVTDVKGEPLYVQYYDKPSISQEAQPKKSEPSWWEKVVKWFTE
jgi:hypothetical protein